MSAALKLNPISVEDYLASELVSPTKHELVDGRVRAMAGGRFRHNCIASNCLTAMAVRLRGTGCRALNSDMKIRVQMKQGVRFYYPEVSVVCRATDPQSLYVDEPATIFEVLSESTRHIDEGEKKEAYLSLPSLRHYVLIEQDEPVVTIFRRTDEIFVRERIAGLSTAVPLPEIGVELPLAEIYDGIDVNTTGNDPA